MTAITERLNSFEDRLRGMEAELVELRRLAAEPGREPEPAEDAPLWSLFEQEREPEPAPAPPPPPASPPPPAARRELDLSALLGARALAWTGGSVTLLGIVFCFALAVERGWIGPGARVALGAAASLAGLGAGAWLRRRFGDTYAATSAAGAGIAGLYATLLAATALYDLVPRPAALVLAAAIAALGAGLALAWSTQTLAALGLLGAILVPLPIAAQDGHLSPVGTAFAVVVLAGATIVTIPRSWRTLYGVATTVTLLEAFALVVVHEPGATAVAAAAWLVAEAGSLWLLLRERSYAAGSLTILGAVFSGWSAALLFHGDGRGHALLAVAGAYVLVSASLWRRDRDVAAVLWAIALAVSALGAAVLVSGVTLTAVWAAEAASLAAIAHRLREPRFRQASLAWLLLAYAHGIGVDAPLSKLFVENADTWVAAVSAAALAAAAGIVGMLEDERRELRFGLLSIGGVAAVYCGSLYVVTLPASWNWGHVAVAGLWSAVVAALAASGLRRPALVASVASTLLVVGYDLRILDDPQRWWAAAAVAAGVLVVSVVTSSVALLAGHVALASAALSGLLDGKQLGAALLVLAAGHAALAVALRARRLAYACALGVAALAVAAPASTLVLHGTWLVLAWAATAASLGVLAVSGERLLPGAVAYLGLAVAHVLALEAPPSDVFVAHRHPGGGIPAVLAVVAACAIVARRSAALREALAWLGGGLALYAATLGILELFEDAGSGVDAAFQRGHTGVSALWGAVGLVLLVAGLKREARRLRVGGFALFGISLAKLFLYDLAFLSSLARAASFLAVGGVLLVGGFFYQRLGTEAELDSPA